ncbi:ABC transporter ATP-binding protein [Hyphomicrobium sp.]|uniref:ABC transporter ATP-binding protein n=1 Tax=Hyphomicrobium sp. TaxID=82 RepID=UPI000F98F260|nr:ABC transporter ATP-binding protein [Hyphomicrobium sp.]RUP10720.1 MAG: ABC transporter ATP-binding protein [Hyphomicrobium sp.]
MKHLNIASLKSGYGSVRIINDFSMTVDRGEIVAVIGRNGVGKTTLMKTIIGNIRTSGGTIEFMSRDITPLSPPVRARLGIGYVPQGRGIFSKLTVEGNLMLGMGVGNSREANLDRAFEFFPVLKKRLSQAAGSMSGGEQQQLAIARILVGAPQIMLLDEPSEGIQPNIVQEIGSTIRRLRREENLTIIIVEQNLNLIQAVADRCIVMDRGAAVATLKPSDLDDPEVSQRYLAIG